MPEVATNRCLSCGGAFAATPPYREVCPRCLLIGGADAMATEEAMSPPTESPPGTVIGNYILREKIGEGGFGIVYRAEQTAPVKREVALKVIKRGMDTDEVVARFSAERQALALMDHPNVSTVFDAGATPGGRPYFVMELVDGEPITAFCDHHEIGVRERLELFIDVCHAVQHAHQKGILHRDLKPSNVLVKSVAEDGNLPTSLAGNVGTLPSSATVKVIDFGVAKALHAELTEETLYTADGRLLGTPEYMSPEQTGGAGGGDVDTRSDVYALGVVLYELLTGTTSLDSAALRGASFGKMERMIREVEPPQPSARAADDPALAKQLRGDLDWIVLKAIEKDRDRRYETASDLASDVARHLANEPVTARPPTTAYRMQKFARRNKPLVIGVAAVFAALLIGAVGMTVLFFDVRSEKRKGETQFRTGLVAGASGSSRSAGADPQQQQDVYEQILEKEPGNGPITDRLVDLLLEKKHPSISWQAMEPITAVSEAGAKLTALPDQSILAEGLLEKNDRYEVQFTSRLRTITALRLEALADPRLPNNGPGRKDNGGFILQEFKVRAGPDPTPESMRPVRFVDAFDDYHYGVHGGIRGFVDDGYGWWPVFLSRGEDHWAVVQLREPIRSPDRTHLSIRLWSGGSDEFSPHWNTTLGRFRISATDVPLAINRERERFEVLRLENPLTRLGAAYAVADAPNKAAETFARALDWTPDPAGKIEIVRTALGFHAAFEQLRGLRPENTAVKAGDGLKHAADGQWEQAGEVFRKAVDVDPAGMPPWIQTSHWVAGPYPPELDSIFPPERNTDPFLPLPPHPAPTAEKGDSRRWEPVELAAEGAIELSPGTCEYVLTRVWSPARQEVAFLMADKGWMRVFVNGNPLFESIAGDTVYSVHFSKAEHRLLVTLEPGWNTILMKAVGRPEASGVSINLSSNPVDLAVARKPPSVQLSQRLIDEGKMEEAAEVLAKATEKSPGNAELYYLQSVSLNELERWEECLAALNEAVANAPEKKVDEFKGRRAFLYSIPNGRWEEAAADLKGLIHFDEGDFAGWMFSVEIALVQLLAGDLDRFKAATDEMDKRIAKERELQRGFWPLMVYLVAPGTVAPINVDRLLNFTGKEDEPERTLFTAAIFYRANRLEEAGDLFQEEVPPGHIRFQFIAAMTWHGLGQDERAKEALELGNRWIDGVRNNGLRGAIPRERSSWHLWACDLILQREANALIDGTHEESPK